MIWATVSSQSFFCLLYSLSIFGYRDYNQSDFSSGNLVRSLCRVFSPIIRRGFLLWSVKFSSQNSVTLCPASFCTPRPNLPVTPSISWLATFAFHFPIMKISSFWGERWTPQGGRFIQYVIPIFYSQTEILFVTYWEMYVIVFH